MNYRSVVVLGATRAVEDPTEKMRALDRLVEHLVPGRSQDARAANEQELKTTLVLEFPVDEASAKVRSGPPVDDPGDLHLDIWAHTNASTKLPAYLRYYGEP